MDYYTENNFVQSHFWVICRTSILNNSYNRLKYVFKQIISIVAIGNIINIININKNMKFNLFGKIWSILVLSV